MNYDLQLENYIKNNLGIKNYNINFKEKGAITILCVNNDNKTINIGTAGGMTRLARIHFFKYLSIVNILFKISII